MSVFIMKFLSNNKKGTIMDIILVSIIAFVVIILFTAVYVAYKETGDALEDAKKSIDNVAGFDDGADLVISNANKYDNFWDYLIVLIIFGMWVGLIIASYLLGNQPLFLVMYVIIIVALLIFSVVFQVAGRNMLDANGFSDYMVDFPITSFFMRYMFLFNLFFIVLSGVALYLKPGGGDFP